MARLGQVCALGGAITAVLLRSAAAQVVINEVVPDPQQDWGETSGGNGAPFDDVPGDGGITDIDEYVELVNTSAGDVDMTGWTLSMADDSPALYTLGEGGATIEVLSAGSVSAFPAGARLVIGNPTGSMSNSVTLELRDGGGNLIDRVAIGTGGAPGFGRDGNASSVVDESVSRARDGVDTGDDAIDFHPRVATPGAANPAVAPAVVGSVLINEVITDPQLDWNDTVQGNGVLFDATPGASLPNTGDEWIELYNASGSTIDLTAWVVEMADTSPGAEYVRLDSAIFFSADPGCTAEAFSAGCHLVVGNPAVDLSNSVVVRLHDTLGIVVDSVELGDDPELDGVGDGAPRGDSTGGAANTPDDESVSRIPDGVDRGSDAADFASYFGTPGAPNPVSSGPPAPLVINEVVSDPRSDWDDTAGGNNAPFDSTPGTGGITEIDEYVELYNPTAQTVNIVGFALYFTDASPAKYEIGSLSANARETYSEGSSARALLPGGHVAIGNPPGAMSSTVVVALEDLFGVAIDSVNVGTGAPAPGRNGSNPSAAGESISRSPDGADSGDDDADFVARAGTPAAANPSPAPLTPGSIVINEIVVDPRQDWNDTSGGNGQPFDDTPGTGGETAADQWLELINTSDAAIDATSFELVMADTATVTEIVAVNEAVLFASDPACTAASFVPGCRLVVGNPVGDIDHTAVLSLFDATHTLLDRVELGDDPEGDGAGDGAAGLTSAGSTSLDDEAIGRLPDGRDSDDDAADFAYVRATPGGENVRPPGQDGSDLGDGGIGGFDAGIGPADSGCGCRAAGDRGAPAVWLAVAVIAGAIRRRRRF